MPPAESNKYASTPNWRRGVVWTAAVAFGFAILSVFLSVRQIHSLNSRLLQETTLAARSIAATASELALQQLETSMSRIAYRSVLPEQPKVDRMSEPAWLDGVYLWKTNQLHAVREPSDEKHQLQSFIAGHVASWLKEPPEDGIRSHVCVIRATLGQSNVVVGLLPFDGGDGPSEAIVANLNVEALKQEIVQPLLPLRGGLELSPVVGAVGSWSQPMSGVLSDWAVKPAHRYVRTQRRIIFWQMATYLAITALALSTLLVSMGLLFRLVRRETTLAQMKANFVADVSHELKTPLATIRLYCETLESGRVTSDEKRLDYYRTIARESTRLSNMINTILDFSRIEAGHGESELRPLDVGEVVRETYDGFQLKLEEEKFKRSLSVESGLPLVLANRDRISQVILNLISNAVKYSEDERVLGIEVTKDTRRGRRGVLISVHDRGMGIRPEERAHLFEGFFRSNESRARARSGTGLGLALVKQIVDAHHGSFHVESRLVKGSTFRIFLPAAEVSSSNDSPPTT